MPDVKIGQPRMSVAALEELGRTRLSSNFYFRDFLYSEIANACGIPNIPHDPALALAAGQRLCQELLEPLNATFGRVAIRSAYRSPQVNQAGNENRWNCASNERNRASHIWDLRDEEGRMGATACVVVPWFADRYAQGADWRSMAYWIHDHLPYSRVTFFPKLCAFNIQWREEPLREIRSNIPPKGLLVRKGDPDWDQSHAEWYADFPEPRQACRRSPPPSETKAEPVAT